jgi:hypothetical protein
MENIDDLRVDETMPETYPGRKSATEIVEDVRKSLNPDNLPVRGCDLLQLLIGYAEQAIEPVGWQAVWRCDSKTNLELKNTLNSPALVEVIGIFNVQL